MQTGIRNMTTGSVQRMMLTFALPIFLSQLFQQLYNTADSMIVGNLLGKEALAAVSSSSALSQLLTSLMVGVALGAGIIISRYFGSGELDVVSDAIHTAVAFGIAAGAILTVAGVILSPVMLRWMGTAPDVMDDSVSYFRCYFYGSMAVMLYNVFTGIMNALGDSKRPLIFLIFSSVLNVILDIVFIAAFHFGVGSAAVATALSQAASAILCLIYFQKPGTFYRISFRKIRFHRKLMREILRVGLPTGVQCRIENTFFLLLALSHAVAGVCRGAGKATVPMIVMLSVWCVFRIIYITVAMSIRHDIRLLFWAYPITWAISSVIFMIYYKKSDWVHGFEQPAGHAHPLRR